MNILNREHVNRRLLAIGAIVALAFASVGIWLTFALLRPTPPRSVTMAIDPEGSFSAELGKQYRESLARAGIELKLAPTAGAVDSMARLRDPNSEISIAIIPGGISNQNASPGLVSLGVLFYEPLWFFYQGKVLEKHEQLQGLRISIGPEGSASRALSLDFLARVGVINRQTATLLPFTPQDSAVKLLSGDIDAAVLMDAWETPLVQQLLRSKDITLVGIRRADAFVALYPYLNKLTLPAGVADLAANRPPSDVLLIAPKASLVVRSDLHPAIQYLLLDAASQIHSGPGVFHAAGQFPAPESIDLPLSIYTRQYYKTGSPFLQRNLPFWLAVLVQQILVLLIPVVGVLYPLLRGLPKLFKWIESRRVYSLYAELRLLEEELASDRSRSADKDFLKRLDQLEGRVSRLWVTASLRPQLYDLRLHIGMVRTEVQK